MKNSMKSFKKYKTTRRILCVVFSVFVSNIILFLIMFLDKLIIKEYSIIDFHLGFIDAFVMVTCMFIFDDIFPPKYSKELFINNETTKAEYRIVKTDN